MIIIINEILSHAVHQITIFILGILIENAKEPIRPVL